MIVSVLCINLEFYVAKALVERCTKDKGHYVPALHHHPLHFGPPKRYKCGICATRMQPPVYRCAKCDWDICKECFRKGSTSTAEGLLRGDKGVHVEEVWLACGGRVMCELVLSVSQRPRNRDGNECTA